MKRMAGGILGLILAFMAILPVQARKAPPPRICLNAGSYLFAKRGEMIFRMSAEDGAITQMSPIRIFMNGGSDNEIITANACDVFFAWAKPEQKSEIWGIGAATGWELRRITRTPEDHETEPALKRNDGSRLAFTVLKNGEEYVATSLLDGQLYRIADKGHTPAWGATNGALSYTTEPWGRLYIWMSKGQWHTHRPDGKAILVQDGTTFTSRPNTGVSRFWGTGKSVAISPDGKFAAVVTTDGHLTIQELIDGFPAGNAVEVPGMEDLEFVTWIAVN
ncbi:MAG TPA: hypothetical protein VJ227_00780 [Patescibacteria group bacterium]|nr:hypothetical protein [Patescibacteria group bacterium]